MRFRSASGDAFLEHTEKYQEIVRVELEATDSPWPLGDAAGLLSKVMTGDRPTHDTDARCSALPQGVLRMSDAVPGLVETSTTWGSSSNRRRTDRNLLPAQLGRSELDDVAQMIASGPGTCQ